MIIDCISDLHGHYPTLEGGDLLIVAGDLTGRDTKEEYKKFDDWIYEQKYKKKIVIAGNHDNLLNCDDPFLDGVLGISVKYLCDSGTEFEGLKIWGSPWTKTFPDMNPKCKAFTLDTEDELFDKWTLAPHDVDILITHSPAYGIFDEIKIKTQYGKRSKYVGSKSLKSYLTNVFRPYLHVFGHIHEAYGHKKTFSCKNDRQLISVNASYVNEHYQPVNKPIRVIL